MAVQGRSALATIALVILVALVGWLIKRKVADTGCCDETEKESTPAPAPAEGASA
jgi:hypothetical protein